MNHEFMVGELTQLSSSHALNIFAFSNPNNSLFAPFTTYIIIAEIPIILPSFTSNIQFIQPNVRNLHHWLFSYTIVTLQNQQFLLMRAKNNCGIALSLTSGEILFELTTYPQLSETGTQTQLLSSESSCQTDHE